MDIRARHSRKKITEAFISLREKKPIEKISVAEICRGAQVNKSTFYAHYKDIYDLSDKIETAVVENIVASIKNPEKLLENPDLFVEELFYAYVADEKIVSTVFSGTRSVLLAQKTETVLKRLIFTLRPEYENDIEKNIILSIKIYGGFYAFQVNKKYGTDKVISVIGLLNKKI